MRNENLKRKWIYIGFLCIFILLTSCKVGLSSYEDYVKTFNQISITDLYELEINENKYVVYTGRETCPHCELFVPKLYDAAKENELIVNYLDSENTSSDTELNTFRKKNGIQFVPDLSVFQGNIKVDSMQISDQTTTEEVKDFLKNIK